MTIIKVDEHKRLIDLGTSFQMYAAQTEDEQRAAIERYRAKYKTLPAEAYDCNGYLYIPRF